MIDDVRIKNVALAKDIELNFSNGFNVLIGETGAGKTIILSAILFALGNKVDKNFIRYEETTAKVDVLFSNIGERTKNILNKFDIAIEDDSLLISRSYNIQGKNDYRINGDSCTLNMIKEIAASLIDCYEQHESVEMLMPKNHLPMLDSYRPDVLQKTKQEIKVFVEKIKEINKQLLELGGSDEKREETIDLLKYQINEIEDMELTAGEDEELKQKLQIMNSSEKIVESLQNTINDLDGNFGCSTSLKNAIINLNSISQYDNNFVELINRLESSKIEIDDILYTLNDYAKNVMFDDDEYQRIDARLDKIKNLKRKYGNSIEEIIDFANASKEKLDLLENSSEIILKLKKNKFEVAQSLYKKCEELSVLRKKLAQQVEDKITTQLLELGMKNSKFIINFDDAPQFDVDFICSENGFDNVEFMFSANLGEKAKSLVKTISGGELSRFMLAVKNVFADTNGIETIILDEVDSGISGVIGSKVAEKIAKLSTKIQIICITHLPQVTAMADNYIFVYKQTEDGKTYSRTKPLEYDEQIEYIAKLISASKVTDSSLEQAKQLKMWGNNFKHNNE